MELDEPKYIFKVSVWDTNLDNEPIDYFVRAYSSNDALKRVLLPNIGNFEISIITICSTLDIIG